MAIAKATLRTVSEFVGMRRAFNCNGTLTGNAAREFGMPYSGRLPAAFHSEFHKAMGAKDAYVVYSYQTPIAWFANGEWYVPNVRYSATTSRHLSATRVNWNSCRQLVRV